MLIEANSSVLDTSGIKVGKVPVMQAVMHMIGTFSFASLFLSPFNAGRPLAWNVQLIAINAAAHVGLATLSYNLSHYVLTSMPKG